MLRHPAATATPPARRGERGRCRYTPPVDLRERIFSTVLQSGFDRVGCLPLGDAGDPGFADWIARGFHGEMEYLARHAPSKADPAAAFAEFRSVVVVALEYGEVAAPSPDPRVGNISRYALGDDYHDVMKTRLFSAADALRAAEPGLATRAFVDTGPLNEKLIASRAGFGWVGRHTNLIDHTRGSYFFLGLLLVSAELEPTGPAEADRCGLCTACIPACPTGAIIEPYVLDARRCISYLTIELRGSIPRELRGLIGNRIFGCDDCQEVCPWNRFARRDPPPEFTPRDEVRTTDLATWLAMDVEEWRRRFRRSPVKRSRHVGFLRNVLVAAGCSGDASLIEFVIPYLDHAEPLLRGHAAWAVGELGPGGQAAIAARRRVETDPMVAEELAAAADNLAGRPEKKTPRR